MPPRFRVRALPKPTGHRFSEFNLMINTNKSHAMYHECLMYLSHTINRPNADSVDASEEVQAITLEEMRHMLQFETSCLGGTKKPEKREDENWKPLMITDPEDAEYIESAEYVWNNLLYDVSVMCAPEQGPNKHRWHVHMLIQIEHDTCLRIDVKMAQAWAVQKLNTYIDYMAENPHFFPGVDPGKDKLRSVAAYVTSDKHPQVQQEYIVKSMRHFADIHHAAAGSDDNNYYAAESDDNDHYIYDSAYESARGRDTP